MSEQNDWYGDAAREQSTPEFSGTQETPLTKEQLLQEKQYYRQDMLLKFHISPRMSWFNQLFFP